MTSKWDDIPEPMRSLMLEAISEASQRTTAWLEEHFTEIMSVDAEDVVMAQLHYASRRDAGEFKDNELDSCKDCGRLRVLEFAALKLWLLQEMGK